MLIQVGLSLESTHIPLTSREGFIKHQIVRVIRGEPNPEAGEMRRLVDGQ
ncbi:hypothetical protein [Nonomuraea sp. NPDC049784]